MKMTIKQSGSHRGQKLYIVTDGVDRMFTGTLEEVKSFVLLHNAKVRERQESADAAVRALRAG